MAAWWQIDGRRRSNDGRPGRYDARQAGAAAQLGGMGVVGSRVTALGLAGAIVLGACGSTPPPSAAAPADSPAGSTTASASPAPTPTASPTPAPTPVDASAAFVNVIGAPDFSANVALSGTTTLGAVTTTTSGTLDLDGASSHLVLTTKPAGGVATRAESLTAGGTRYTTRYGLWFEAGPALDNDLAATLTAISGGVVDSGVEAVDGAELHHLTVPPPTTMPAALALSGAAVSNVAITVDAWAQEDGTPVRITVAAEWDQVVATKPVHGSRTLDLVFSNVGNAAAISAPTDLWRLFTSKRYHYQIAYPVDWEAQAGTKTFLDSFFGFDAQNAFAERFKSYGFTTNQISSELTRHASDITGFTSVKVLSNKSAKLSGQRARVIEISGKYKGVRYWWIIYFTVKSGYVYWLELRTDVKTTDADRTLAAKFAASYTIR